MALTCPRDLSHANNALDFLERLPAYESAPSATIDFSQVSFARPYATLLLAQGLRQFIRERAGRGLQTFVNRRGIFIGERQSAISYLGHVGFFEYLGIDYGNAPGEARGGPSYLPLTAISRAELEANRKSGVIQDAVRERSRHLASMVFEDEYQQDILEYCFREIIRNVFEHAGTDSCTLMAQKYRGDQVEIAVADAGIGVFDSLSPTHALPSPEAALRAALRPGVSRVIGPQSNGQWDNTGFGLYVTSRLGRDTGGFAITSSGLSLSLSETGDVVRQAAYRGTAIRLLVSASEAEYFPNRLHQIVEDGEREIQAETGYPKPASKGTRMSGQTD